MMLKHAWLVELLLLARDWKQIHEEITWLLESTSVEEVQNLVRRWLPSVDPDLFASCIRALQADTPVLRRILLGKRLQSHLQGFARQSALRAWYGGITKFTRRIIGRLTRAKVAFTPASGGAVIAIVGPEATGKSTLLREMHAWLGEHFVVKQIHVGKPKSTLLSAGPNLFVPALRAILPAYRSGRVENDHAVRKAPDEPDKVYPLIFALRSVLLAYDRRMLLKQAFARAANGAIVLCDRYPSATTGAPDSPQLSPVTISRSRYPIHHLLARLERQLYQEINPPDLVIALSVPVEIAILRNRTRGKEEPEDYVRQRHARSAELTYLNTTICNVSTDQPLENTLLEIKRAIWKAL
jgi:thymidylate kinase